MTVAIIFGILLIALVVGAFILYLHYYPFLKICGDSMYPTLKDGELYIGLRYSHDFEPLVGKIYVFKPPNEKRKKVIKRLTCYNSENNMCYFVGDNMKDSYDSRDYGWVSADCIIAMLYRKVGK